MIAFKEAPLETREQADVRQTVLLLANGDPYSIRTWSSTPYYIRNNLEALGFRVIYCNPYAAWLRGLIRGITALNRRSPLRTVDPNRFEWIVRRLSRRVADAVRREGPTFVFGISCSYQWGFLREQCPEVKIVAYGDATFAQMVDYYPQYARLSATSLRGGMALFERTLSDADLLLWPSNWALESARSHALEGAGDRNQLLPFRPNMPPEAFRLAEVATETATGPRFPDAPLEVLFIGVDWERKGGPIVAAAVDTVRRAGHEVRLTIVGLEPPRGVPGTEDATVYPRLEKTDPAELEQLCRLLARSDLLFVPTHAEAYGVVFVEALLFGVPTLSRRTGGVPGAVAEEAAVLLPEEAGVDEFTAALFGIIEEPGRLSDLRAAARQARKVRGSWEAWRGELAELLGEIGIAVPDVGPN